MVATTSHHSADERAWSTSAPRELEHEVGDHRAADRAVICARGTPEDHGRESPKTSRRGDDRVEVAPDTGPKARISATSRRGRSRFLNSCKRIVG